MWALVGIPPPTDSGSAHVFERNTASAMCTETGTLDPWCHQAKLTASDGAAFDDFGISVSVSGDTVVVGAVNDDALSGFDFGSAYVFVRDASLCSPNLWELYTTLAKGWGRMLYSR